MAEDLEAALGRAQSIAQAAARLAAHLDGLGGHDVIGAVLTDLVEIDERLWAFLDWVEEEGV
jgi:hypothetical protein